MDAAQTGTRGSCRRSVTRHLCVLVHQLLWRLQTICINPHSGSMPLPRGESGRAISCRRVLLFRKACKCGAKAGRVPGRHTTRTRWGGRGSPHFLVSRLIRSWGFSGVRLLGPLAQLSHSFMAIYNLVVGRLSTNWCLNLDTPAYYDAYSRCIIAR
jgi:hypothetical protein